MWWLQTPGGRRPALILTRETAIPLLSRVFVVPATTSIRGIPSEVRLTRSDGMPEECVLALDNVRSVPKRMLRAHITTLTASRLDEVCDALAYALGC